MNPVKILVVDKYVRAVEGGVGSAKTGVNYAASLFAAEEAKQPGSRMCCGSMAGSASTSTKWAR